MCVLKPDSEVFVLNSYTVTPYMGVCIETQKISHSMHECSVTPYMGVCIETDFDLLGNSPVESHTLYGCVY